MSAAPDPAELAPSRDPAAYGRRPLFGSGVFVWLLLCLACLAVGGAIGRFGFPSGPAAKPEILALETPARPSAPIAAPPAPAPMTPPPASAAPTPGGADAAMADRVARLETASTRQSQAAAQALAAATLSVAAEGSAPFDRDLAAYERLAPTDPDLRPLIPLAATGAASRATLAATLPDFAAAAVVAVREPARDAGFFAKLWALIGKVVVVRKVDPDGVGVDGLLARAQQQASAGDLEDAVRTLQGLPPAGRAQLAEWTAAAQRRIEIDRRVASLRARALAELTPPDGAR